MIETARLPLRLRPRPCLGGALPALLLLSVLLAPAPVRADCAAVDPENIECSGVDADGFEAGPAVEQITVIAGASVDNGGSDTVDALRLVDGLVLDVQAGAAVTASGNGRAAVRGPDDLVLELDGDLQVDGGAEGGVIAGERATVNLRGSLAATGAAVRGIAAGAGGDNTEGPSRVTLFEGSLLEATGDGAVGIEMGDNGDNSSVNVSVAGRVEVVGDDAFGIRTSASETDIGSAGVVVVTGARVVGIDGGDGSRRIENNGSVSVDGVDAVGLRFGDDAAANLVNIGSISASGSGAMGMRSGAGSHILSSVGSITLDASAAGGIGIDYADGLGVGQAARVINGGTIEIAADGGIGIRVGDRSDVDNNPGAVISVTGVDGTGIEVDAFADVLNQGLIEATGLRGIGVDLGASGGNGSQLRNAGTIQGGTGMGVAVRLGGSGGGTVQNFVDGEIRGGPGGAAAIRGGAGPDVVANAGRIVGATLLGGGDDRYTLEVGGSFQGLVDGGADVLGDVFRLQGQGAAALDLGSVASPTVVGFERLELAAGEWALSGAGGWAGDLAVVGDDGSQEFGTLLLDSTLVVAGDYVQEDGTTLVVVVDALAGSGGLDVAGAATLGDADADTEGALLEVRLAAGDGAALFADGTTIPILDAASGLTGSFQAVTLPADTAVLAFGETTDATGVELTVSRSAYADLASSRNASALGSYIDRILATGPTGDLAGQLGVIDQLDAAGFASALAQLDAEAYEAHSVMALAAGQRFGRLLTDRPLVCGNLPERNENPVVPCGARGWEPWADLLIVVGENQGDGEHIDFDYKGGGLAFGADHRLSEALAVGVALGASATRSEIEAHGDGVLSTVELGVRGEYRLGGFGARAALDYGHGWHTSERDLRVGADFRQGDGDFGSNRVGARLEGSYEQRFGALRVQPLLGLDFTWLGQESFDETGAGDLSLRVDSRSDSLLGGTVGLRLSGYFVRYSFLQGVYELGDGVWTPELSVRYRRVFTGADRELEASFRGASPAAGDFTTRAEGQQNEADIGAALHYQPTAGMTVSARYDLLVGDVALDHVVGANLRFPF